MSAFGGNADVAAAIEKLTFLPGCESTLNTP